MKPSQWGQIRPSFLNRGAEGLARQVEDNTSPFRATRAEPQPISRPKHKRCRPGRVDPPAPRRRRAQLRCMALVELGPLAAATQRPRLAVASGASPHTDPLHAGRALRPSPPAAVKAARVRIDRSRL
jgi:hypothetical protein